MLVQIIWVQLKAMDQLKEQSRMMKEAILKGQLNAIGEILDFGFEQKKRMAENISNSIYWWNLWCCQKSGATGGKISGGRWRIHVFIVQVRASIKSLKS